MVKVEVKFSKTKLAAAQRAVGSIKNGMAKVVSRAINKTAGKARTQLVRTIAGALGWTHSRVTQQGIPKLAGSRRATFRRWLARLEISGYRISLSKFKPKGTIGGVTWKRGKTARTVPGAFKLPRAGQTRKEAGNVSQERPVFKWSADAKAGRYSSKSMIKLYGPSMQQIYEDEATLGKAFEKKVLLDLDAELDRQIGVLLSQV